jgi:hypothetical protein
VQHAVQHWQLQEEQAELVQALLLLIQPAAQAVVALAAAAAAAPAPALLLLALVPATTQHQPVSQAHPQQLTSSNTRTGSIQAQQQGGSSLITTRKEQGKANTALAESP